MTTIKAVAAAPETPTRPTHTLPPWRQTKPTYDELWDALVRTAVEMESHQQVLVLRGDRTEPYAPTMRRAYCFEYLALMIEVKKRGGK